MYKKIFRYFGLMLGLIIAVSCTSKSQENKSVEPSDIVVGGDRDSHGCIGSAGYQWSEVLKDCIRPFESGVRLATCIDTTSTSAAYLVFSPDSSKIEAFLPYEEIPPVLKKEVTDGDEMWKCEDHRRYAVRRPDGKWTIYKDGKWLFTI